MSLFKRGNVWWSYFYVDGIRHQYSTGTSNRRQAETIEAKLKEEVNNRRFQLVQIDPNMTFGELAARFIASGIARPHHLYHLKFLLPFFAEVPVLRLTKPLAEEFRRKRKARPITCPIKDATVNRDLSVLRHILYWAVDEQLLASQSAGAPQNGARAAHPAAGAERGRGATAARSRARCTCAP